MPSGCTPPRDICKLRVLSSHAYFRSTLLLTVHNHQSDWITFFSAVSHGGAAERQYSSVTAPVVLSVLLWFPQDRGHRTGLALVTVE